MALAIYQDANKSLMLMQTAWAKQLNPLLANPMNGMSIIKNVPLVSGSNVINHGLGQVQQGWMLVDIQGPAVIYRDSPFNALTLSLHSDAPTTVSIGVF